MNKLDVFEYNSSSKYLRDIYKVNNVRGEFSYRTIACYLSMNLSIVYGIFNGKLRISSNNFKKILGLLGLNKKETERFEFLVYVSQADIPKKIKRKIIKRGI